MTTKWTILYYSPFEHLHAEHIRASNPEAQLILLDSRNSLPPALAWRSCDRMLRDALKSTYNSILHDNVFLIEWDVLVSVRLPDISVRGAQVSVVPTPEEHPDWMWWPEFDLLPPMLQIEKRGAVPFGILAMDKQSLWKLLDPSLDGIFEQDIIAEIRFPAVCALCGINLSELDPSFFPTERILRSMTEQEVAEYNARFDKTFLTQPGVYHPVKYPVSE